MYCPCTIHRFNVNKGVVSDENVRLFSQIGSTWKLNLNLFLPIHHHQYILILYNILKEHQKFQTIMEISITSDFLLSM